VTRAPRAAPLTSASGTADGSHLGSIVVCSGPRELTTATGRDRVVPWMACRSTP
jgi:hypothetical protein